MDIRKRLKDILLHYDVTINSIASDGAMQTRLSRQINAGSTITFDTLMRFLELFPDVSAEWLFRGKGNMLISDNLPSFHGEESESEEELHARLSKLQVEYDNEVEEHQKLLAQLEYMEDYNRRMAVENHNLKKKLSHYEPQDKKAII